jgi:hypothetical protein
MVNTAAMPYGGQSGWIFCFCRFLGGHTATEGDGYEVSAERGYGTKVVLSRSGLAIKSREGAVKPWNYIFRFHSPLKKTHTHGKLAVGMDF